MNSLGASVLSTEEGKAKYDQTMLNVLSDKQVLAWILKRFVSEYEHLPLEEIEKMHTAFSLLQPANKKSILKLKKIKKLYRLKIRH